MPSQLCNNIFTHLTLGRQKRWISPLNQNGSSFLSDRRIQPQFFPFLISLTKNSYQNACFEGIIIVEFYCLMSFSISLAGLIVKARRVGREMRNVKAFGQL